MPGGSYTGMYLPGIGLLAIFHASDEYSRSEVGIALWGQKYVVFIPFPKCIAGPHLLTLRHPSPMHLKEKMSISRIASNFQKKKTPRHNECLV